METQHGPHIYVPKINIADPSTITEKELAKLSYSEKIELAKRNVQAVIQRVIADPWFFCSNFVVTLDTHDAVNPKKKLPDKEYLRVTTEIWQREPLLLIPKSRQMMVSWLMIALHYWMAAYHQGKFVFFQSKKEEDADILLDRANFVHLNLVSWLQPNAKPKSYCRMVFPGMDSKIQAVSQAADSIRSQTASAIFSDEMAFQPHSRDAYAAAKPTIDGGGKFTGVSTPNFKEFFYNLVMDLE